MAEKKTVKKAVKKASKKVAKVAKKGVKKGDAYKCTVCGLVVSIDETCGCIDACDLICCEQPMKAKKRA